VAGRSLRRRKEEEEEEVHTCQKGPTVDVKDQKATRDLQELILF
jgi:hypothetical protein